MKSNRIIIPTILRKDIIKRIHLGHPGRDQCYRRARDSVFWPGINDQIKQEVSACATCAENADNQQKQPLQTTEIPKLPFERVAIDICEVQAKNQKKHNLLVTVDYFSDYIEVDFLSSLTATNVINCCKRNFSRHGIPKIVVSDCGPQFTSREFQQFAKDWNFKLSMSSPYHHQANGKAESAVKITKKIYERSIKSGEDFWKALCEHRKTSKTDLPRPAQRLFARRLRTSIPTAKSNLIPEVQQNIPAMILEKRGKMKKIFRPNSQNITIHRNRTRRLLPKATRI
ncbi:uncharacterized protein K02A2.6-like [Eupeodes corollae]|uniref:uncharacterized protein K02A2.6-like n=1 Tax=Eupeodes corollae TaxID=290404 RepID=UPI0024928BE0|nr:uncharacterized protein K02A2.6-like [Eupeodes corollae]